jgi:hypothetical protein
VLAASPATGQASAAHPRPGHGLVIHEPGGVVIHYFAHPVGPLPLNQARTTNVYLVCPTYYNVACLGATEVEGAVGLVGALVSIVCSIFVNCPQVWRTIVKGSGKHTGLVTFEDEGTYETASADALHDCVGASPNAADQGDRAYLSSPGRCTGVTYQSWKYQEGSKPIYRFVNRFAELAYGRTDVLAQLSKRNGADLYAKTATQLPSGAYAHWSIFVAGTCSPC